MRPAAVEWVSGERDQLRDLDLRIYAPIREVVIVRVGGVIDRLTAPVLAQRVEKQLTRAPHVVVDLGEVTVVDPRSLGVLCTLADQATASGTELHIARAEDDDLRGALQIMGLDQLFTLDPTAEAVIARVRAERAELAWGSWQGRIVVDGLQETSRDRDTPHRPGIHGVTVT